MYVIKALLPNLMRGATFTIDGIGELTNGEELIVTAEEAQLFREMHRGPEGELGPTLLQAFKGVEGISVTKQQADASDNEGGDK